MVTKCSQVLYCYLTNCNIKLYICRNFGVSSARFWTLSLFDSKPLFIWAFVNDLSTICQRFVKDLSNIFQRFVNDLSKTIQSKIFIGRKVLRLFIILCCISAIEMDNIDDASEITDVSHINKVCRLLEVGNNVLNSF